jgi:hypothetical protein
MREKYIRSFYVHPTLGKLLPLADNDPLLYEQGPVLVIDAENRSERMLFSNLKDWDNVFLFFGKDKYRNTHKDKKANYKRTKYKLAYYSWSPDSSLQDIKLQLNYPINK